MLRCFPDWGPSLSGSPTPVSFELNDYGVGGEVAKETRLLAAAETVIELMDPLSSPLTTEFVLKLFMVLAFLMKPGIVPTSVGRLIYIPGEDPLLFGNHVVWIPRRGGEG